MSNKKTSADIIYGKGNNDECYTPAYAVYPILEFLKGDEVIWCPFDTEKSNFVKIFKDKGHKVIYSHISKGQDFLKYEPKEQWDIIISNPPFTNKKLMFERALSFNKPFALIMSNTWLNDSAPKYLFKDKDLELLMFDKRIEFLNQNYEQIGNRVSFSSSYYCYKLLPKQIVIKNLLVSKEHLVYDEENLFKDLI